MGNNINVSEVIGGNIQVPAFRFNPKVIADIQNIKKEDINIIWKEYQASQKIFEQIQQMKFFGDLDSNAVIAFKPIEKSEQYVEVEYNTKFREILTLNDKEVNFEMVYSIIGKRFHECLKKEADKSEYKELSDRQLVHQICKRERLTFYNYLRMHNLDGGRLTEEHLKSMINREYSVYFKRDRVLDIYKEDDVFFIKPAFNTLDKKFKVDFS